MSKKDSTTLWRSRIQSRELSGLKLKDWCEQNNISRDAYYYWYRKLNIKEDQSNIFAEVMLKPEPMVPVEKVTKPEILITWKDFTISITDQPAIPMVAELLSSLEKLC